MKKYQNNKFYLGVISLLMITSFSLASSEIIDLTTSPIPASRQNSNKRSVEDNSHTLQQKKARTIDLTFEKACETHNIHLPTLEEAKQAIKPKIERLKATLPGGITAIQQIMKEMQEVGREIRNSQFEKAAELASYFVAVKVLEHDMRETLKVVSNENYQHLNEHDFTMLCVVVIASIDIKEKLIKLADYLQKNQNTSFIDCNQILRTAQQVNVATEDIQQTVLQLSQFPHEEETEEYED